LAENVYEGLFIFDANKFARDQAGVPAAVEKMVTDAGGEVIVSRLWEERRLAYPIRGQRKGAYWLIYFRQDGDKIASLNRACELKGGVLEDRLLSRDEIEQLAKLPSLEVLQAQLLGLLNKPATLMVQVLAAVPQNMVQVLQAKVDKENEG